MKHYIYLILVAFALFSCSSDDDSIDYQPEEGTIADIKNWANPEIIDAIESIGFTIHEGTNPPNIEGSFQISSRILEATNVPNDFSIGTTFYTINMTFSDQNNDSLTVNFMGEEIAFDGTVAITQEVENFLENSYISGNGDSFTAFFKVTETNGNNQPVQVLYVFSGDITENGISNIQNALFMLDNFGQNQTYIENNTGRIFIDSDGVAEPLT